MGRAGHCEAEEGEGGGGHVPQRTRQYLAVVHPAGGAIAVQQKQYIMESSV